MSHPTEDARISRRGFLQRTAGLAGSLAAGSLVGPELAAAIPRRRLSPTKVVLMGKELTAADVKAFEADHPNITIELLNVDAAKFEAMMAAGQPPDIWRTQGPLVPQWAARGQLLNLDPYFAASDLLHPADLTSANDYYRYKNGKIGIGPRYEGINTGAYDPQFNRIYGLTHPRAYFVYYDVATKRKGDLGRRR